MDIREATRAYESWLATQTTIVRADLALKHRRMTESPFVFLRGTFYRWIARWPDVCSDLRGAPRVLAVGDLHVENFGTWRDAEGRLVWGVNDVDEACRLPCTQDLVRLATSALLAIAAHHFNVSVRAACEAVLEGYRASLARGGRPIVLAERRRWLRDIALNDLRDPVVFWAKFEDAPAATGRVPARALQWLLPTPKPAYRTLRRVAGVGSLGRPRFVALAEWNGGLIAREAKAAVPSASAWAAGRAETSLMTTVLRRAVRVPDPFFGVRDGWIVRRLAPDCTRIELADLPKRRDELRLLRAMGWETANIHLGSMTSHRLAADLARRPARWLERAATDMSRIVSQDWRDWVKGAK